MHAVLERGVVTCTLAEDLAAAEAKREEADDISRPALGRQVSGAL